MKIASPADDKIIIELTADDMRELDISYDEMDYSTVETRRVIWALLERAGEELGRDIDPSERMVIETVPEVCGGCLVCFTILQRKRAVKTDTSGRKIRAPLIAEFRDVNAMLDAAKALAEAAEQVPENKVFEKKGSYRVVFKGTPGVERIKRLLSDFTVLFREGELAASETEEHWRSIGSSLL